MVNPSLEQVKMAVIGETFFGNQFLSEMVRGKTKLNQMPNKYRESIERVILFSWLFIRN